MNVYDFDNTIYKGDSTADFYIFSLKRHPKIFLLLPSLGLAFAKFYLFKIGSKTEFKQVMYRFLRYCDTKKDTADFWDSHIKNIKSFYKEIQREDDVIISASPEFLLSPACERLGIRHLIASKVNPETGIYSGVNCHGREKVRRLYKELGSGISIDSFYSDSKSDAPLAEISEKAYLVKGSTISDWNR